MWAVSPVSVPWCMPYVYTTVEPSVLHTMTRATHPGGTLHQNMSIACCVARALRVEWFRETCVREVAMSAAMTTCKRNGASHSANGTADSLQTTSLRRATSLQHKFAAVLRFATNRELTHEHD
jgi:hypothetical protein